MRRILSWVAAAAVLMAPAVTLGSASPAGAVLNGPVTIRVELDRPNPGDAGPAVFQAVGVTPGPGPELTAANLISNPSSWSGSLTVDMNPDTSQIIVSTGQVAAFQTAKVTITGLPFSDLTTVSDALWSVSDGTQMPLGTIRGFNEGIILNWHSIPKTTSVNLAVGGTAVFTYDVLEMTVTPNPATTGQPIAIAGELCVSGNVALTLSGSAGILDQWTELGAADGTWASSIVAGALAPGTYSLAASCTSDGSFNYLPVSFVVTAPAVATTTTTTATPAQPATATPAKPAFTG